MKNVDPEIYKDFRKLCLDLGLPTYKVSEILFKAAVYLIGNQDFKTSISFSEEASILLHLQFAREKMEKCGVDTSGIDEVIRMVESFLKRPR